MKIAMWSGPRNLSTAMMYAFGNRADTSVQDEPFYAAFLQKSGLDHPMRDEILASHETDPDKIARGCSIIPDGVTHLYMKHMAHHMIADFPLDWARDCTNVHLIRHPARVIRSYTQKREHPTLEDLGFPQQLSLFETLGGLVIDSADILSNPERMLRSLCAEIGIGFDSQMLKWDAGPRVFDGVWAKHWYGAVHRSTGFGQGEPPLPELDADELKLMNAAMPFYEALADRRISYTRP